MNYQNIIIIKNPPSELHFKEALDIALVCASYEISVAVFINAEMIDNDEYQSSMELAQSLNMLAEFSVPLFSDKDVTFHHHQLQSIKLSVLQSSTKHQLVF